ncbi:PIN-like domain-containing protein [Nocardia sp. NPDC058658]|uniref:PIN-like domain-containing protein n=1 Tax=Nocardia sp. NPDC058658 TaxID=3346580 RepID=UPI00365C2030
MGTPSDSATFDTTKGLFADFSAYRNVVNEDYQEVFRTGIVTFDTNILLDLYRQHRSASDQLFSAMEALGDRLWISHQALKEFHRNRIGAAESPADEAEKTTIELDKYQADALVRFRHWAKRVGISAEHEAGLAAKLAEGFEALYIGIQDVIGDHDPESAVDTETDPIVLRLEGIVRGRRGEPMDRPTYVRAVAEAEKRVREKIPPGYKDANKSKRDDAEGAAGDYLVWEQFLVEAAARGVDGLLVTGDAKEDWYRKERGQNLGPRNELSEEYLKRTGKRLFMLTAASWLHHMKPLIQALPGSQDEATVDTTVDALERSMSDEVRSEPGWNRVGVVRLIDELRDAYPVQYAAIREAGLNGGYITRDQVYDLANYSPNRSLRGFTRPIQRIAKNLKDEEVIPYYSQPALSPEYDYSATGNNQAVAFRLSIEFMDIYDDLRDGE